MTILECIICKEPFERNKYSPRQKVCSKAECQHARQISSMKEWRTKHPDYFKYDESKGEEWLRTQRDRSKVWRQRNPDKIKAYRQAHLQDYRSYMREYMKKYRENKKNKGGASDSGENPGNPPVNPNPQDPSST